MQLRRRYHSFGYLNSEAASTELHHLLMFNSQFSGNFHISATLVDTDMARCMRAA